MDQKATDSETSSTTVNKRWWLNGREGQKMQYIFAVSYFVNVKQKNEKVVDRIYKFFRP